MMNMKLWRDIEERKLLSSMVMILVSILTYTILVICTPIVYGEIMDERIYVTAGKLYIADPRNVLKVNWEHPPLAKYIIGLLWIVFNGSTRLINYMIGIITILIFTRLLNLIDWRSRFTMYLVLFLLSADMVFAHVTQYSLLDTYMMPFMLASFYFFLKFLNRNSMKYLLFSSLLVGLAIACKFTAIYLLLTVLIYIVFMYRKGLKFVSTAYLVLIVTTLSTFTIPYLPLLVTGVSVNEVIMNIFNAVSYHQHLHFYGTYVSLQSLLTFFFKVGIWEVYSCTMFMYPNVTLVSSSEWTYTGVYLHIYYGLGALSWYMFLPSLIFMVYIILKRAKSIGTRESFIVFSAIIWAISLLHGDIEWYYYDVLPVYYMLLGLVLRNIKDRWKILLIVMSIIYDILILSIRSWYITLPILS